MNTLLLIIDVQMNFVPDGVKGQEYCRSIETLQNEYSHIAISKFINTPGSSWVKYLNWDEMMEGEESTNLAFTPAEHAFLFTSNTFTSYAKDLKNYIRNNDISEIHICGVDTEACILATAFDLWDAQISFQILINHCISSAGDNLHSSAQHIMNKNFGFEVVKPKEESSSNSK